MNRVVRVLPSLVTAAAMSVIGLWSVPASAADVAAPKPVYKAPVIEAWNPWMIRVRALGVVTRNSGHVDTVAGSDLSTTDTIVPELDITYFFTRNLAAELVLGTTPHTITGTGSINNLPVGKAWLLPPTLTFQYHFTNFGAFKPYVGAGVNYTIFYSQSAGNSTVGGLTVTNSHLHNTFGGALQVGFDYMIDRHWGINVDVKYLYLRPDWDGTINGAAFTGKVNLDPILIGAGVVYKF